MLTEFKELVQLRRQIKNLRGDGTITVSNGTNGIVVGLDLNQLLPKIPKTSGTGIHSAFCKTAAGAYSSIVCYLDTDLTGTEIGVTCEICGGSALNTAIPRLELGDRIFVIQDGAYWRALQIFQAGDENC